MSLALCILASAAALYASNQIVKADRAWRRWNDPKWHRVAYGAGMISALALSFAAGKLS
jgi:hypothetical protein